MTYFGDGATVKKPLINILASGTHLPVAVLVMVDATAHCLEGGLKDAQYIASLFRPHIDRFASEFPDTTDNR